LRSFFLAQAHQGTSTGSNWLSLGVSLRVVRATETAQIRRVVGPAVGERDDVIDLRGNIPAYLTVLSHLQRRTNEVDFSSLSAAEQSLRADGALTDTDDGRGLLGGAFGAAGR
jgi:hypothetical protein